MKEDNWNLKGKKFFGYNSQGMVFASAAKEKNLQEMYWEDDVEILRQKLIEDFEEINDWLIKIDDSVDMDKIIEIINKRFGFE